MRTERRTKQEWQAILAAQQASGLTDHEYCAKHNIHIKTFSARKSDINKRMTPSASKLVKVVKSKPPVLSTAPMTIVHHGVTLNVAQAVDAKWLADVMKALAS